MLIEALASDDWWTGVTLPVLETARLLVRSLVQLVERTSRNLVYTDFVDTLADRVEIELTGRPPGMDLERFRARTQAYLHEHEHEHEYEDEIAIQKLRRNRQLTPDLSRRPHSMGRTDRCHHHRQPPTR